VLANAAQTTVTNGLNQLATVNGTAAAYDARGNMTTDPVTGKTQSYLASNNQLWNVPSPFTTLSYDALDRLASANNGGAVTGYASDGTDIIAEYNGSNVLQKRYAFDGSGSPLVAHDASGNRTWLLADERGSIIALANDSAAMTAIDTYDEYGIPAAANQGTFQYAGMLWLSGPGLYAPTFRAYGAHLGRFNQTDPIGYASGVSLYGYVFSDPVNFTDPLGLQEYSCDHGTCQDLVVVHCQNGGTALPVSGGAYVCIPPTKDVAISGGGPSSGGERSGGGVDRDGGNQEQKQPTCNTVLPNGQSIGDVVRQSLRQTLANIPASTTTFGTAFLGSVLGNVLGTFDFKNRFRGQGDPAELAAAGNFAYGAYVSALFGSGVSNFGARAYGTVTNALGLKPNQFVAPNGMSVSAAANVPRGNANAGCPK